MPVIDIANHSQLWIFFAIIGVSFILEDVAIISAAILASNNQISLSLAFLAAFSGIMIGDLGLFFLGRLARFIRYLRYKIYQYKKIRSIRNELLTRPIHYILILRFAPGLRTVGYMSCGFIGIGFWKFLFSATISVFLWTLIITLLVYNLSSVPFLANSPLKWGLLPISLGIIYLMNRKTRKANL